MMLRTASRNLMLVALAAPAVIASFLFWGADRGQVEDLLGLLAVGFFGGLVLPGFPLAFLSVRGSQRWGLRSAASSHEVWQMASIVALTPTVLAFAIGSLVDEWPDEEVLTLVLAYGLGGLLMYATGRSVADQKVSALAGNVPPRGA